MPIRVGAGAQRGVAGGSLGVGVVVVAIFKVSAVVQKEAEAAGLEITAIPVKVVGAKLVNHQDDDQPGMCIVGAGPGQLRPWNNQQRGEQRAETTLERGHGAPTSIAKHEPGASERRRIRYMGVSLKDNWLVHLEAGPTAPLSLH